MNFQTSLWLNAPISKLISKFYIKSRNIFSIGVQFQLPTNNRNADETNAVDAIHKQREIRQTNRVTIRKCLPIKTALDRDGELVKNKCDHTS